MPPNVVALFLNTVHRQPMQRVQSVTVTANVGLEGDRHARADHHRTILVMQKEDVDRFGLEPGDVREQVTVDGFDLYGPAEGARVRVGGATLQLGGNCAPCPFMDSLKPGLRDESDGFRGRFASAVTDGSFAVGDMLAVEPARETETT